MFLVFVLIFLCLQSFPCNGNVIANSRTIRGHRDNVNIESANEIKGKPLKSEKPVDAKDAKPVTSTLKIFTKMAMESTTVQRATGLSSTTENISEKRRRLVEQYRRLMEDLRECKKVKSQTGATQTSGRGRGKAIAEGYRRVEGRITTPEYDVSGNRVALSGKHLDLMPARGSHVEKLRGKKKLCFKKKTNPEGGDPKSSKKGKKGKNGKNGKRKSETKSGRDYAHTKAPELLLPRCCNCCKFSVLGCY